MTTHHPTQGIAPGASDVSPAPGPAERALRVELTLNAPGSAVWEAWSSAGGLETFLAPKANTEGKIGGAYSSAVPSIGRPSA